MQYRTLAVLSTECACLCHVTASNIGHEAASDFTKHQFETKFDWRGEWLAAETRRRFVGDVECVCRCCVECPELHRCLSVVDRSSVAVVVSDRHQPCCLCRGIAAQSNSCFTSWLSFNSLTILLCPPNFPFTDELLFIVFFLLDSVFLFCCASTCI